MTITVLPCPFCSNDDPEIDEVELGVCAVICNECGCTGPIQNYDNASATPEEAIEQWNRRGAIAL